MRLKSFAAALLAQPLFAFAGGSVQIESGQGKDAVRSSIEFDGDLLRVNPQAGGEMQGYMIFRDGKPYMVSGEGSSATVIEMTSMARMAGNMLKNMDFGGSTYDDVAVYHGLKATGRTEAHAGITGEVHLLEYTTQKGQRMREEMVLAKHPVLMEMNRATTQFGLVIASAMGIQKVEGERQLMAEFDRRNVGVLRYGADYRVTGLSSSNPSGKRFVLPAAPTAMPDLGGMMGGAGSMGDLGALMGGAQGSAQGSASSNAQGNGQGGGFFGRVFGQKAERQQERVEQRAESEVDAATDKAVDSVLDKAFERIFGK